MNRHNLIKFDQNFCKMEGFGIKDDFIEAVLCKIEVLQQEIVCSQEYLDSMTLLHEQSMKRRATELKSLLLSQNREKKS